MKNIETFDPQVSISSIAKELKSLQEFAKENQNRYQYSETQLLGGGHVSFTGHPKLIDVIKQALFLVSRIDLPTEHPTTLDHGSYESYSRYDIEQHEYAASMVTYIELLEIKNPPDGRCPIVIYRYDRGVSSFSEWKDLSSAITAFNKLHGYWSKEKVLKQKGFLRWVDCGLMSPWFYAVGNQHLIEDYCFPRTIQEHPVYTFNKQFLVENTTTGSVAVKTCMGAGLIESEGDYAQWMIHFHDGSTIYEPGDYNEYKIVRPVESKVPWKDEALAQFKEVLLGNETVVDIQFTNDTKFHGSIKNSVNKKYQQEAQYHIEVTFSDNTSEMGWTHVGDRYFVPTEDYPDILTYIKAKMLEADVKKNRIPREISSIRVIEIRTPKGRKSKKWSGVAYQY